jgi:hypothetical protein
MGHWPPLSRGHSFELPDEKKGIHRMEIKRSGSQPCGQGPAEYFTGTVRIDPLRGAAPGAPVS